MKLDFLIKQQHAGIHFVVVVVVVIVVVCKQVNKANIP